MIWGDIALQHPEILKLLPRDALITTWTYEPMDSYAKYIDPIAAAGFEFFVGPGVLNSARSMPEYRGTFANIRGFTRDGKERGAGGVLTCVWDDGGSALFSRDWYGVAYGADQSWHNSPGDTTFDGRHDQGLYGDPTRRLTSGIRRLQEIAEIPATDAMTERVFWQSLIPARGEKGIIDLSGWDRVLEVVGEAEPFLRAVPRRGFGGDADAFLLTIAQYRTTASTRIALVEAARRYRQACLIQRNDRPGARRLVREAGALIDTLIAGVRRCRDLYQQLWLRENRPYALDRILDRFDAQVAELRDTRRRLNGALALAEKNEPLPVPGEVRLWIEEATGAYLREWLVCGPVAGADLTTDALQAMGGEPQARPAVTQEFLFQGATYRWRRLASQEPARVDLSKISESPGVVYAYATIESGSERTVQAVCGSSGGIQVALNGSTVYRSEGPRPYSADTDSFSLPLARGTNHLLLKFDKPAGDAAFSLKLEKTPLRNRKNRYRVDE
jgi:hypothetical protein